MGFPLSSVIQRSGPTACPVTIANGLLDILLAIGASATPLLKNGNANFAVIQRFLQGLLPTNARRLRRLVVLEANTEMKPGLYTDEEGREFEDYSAFVVHGVDEAKLERLGLKRRLEAVSGGPFAGLERGRLAGEVVPQVSATGGPRRCVASGFGLCGRRDSTGLHLRLTMLAANPPRSLAEKERQSRAD